MIEVLEVMFEVMRIFGLNLFRPEINLESTFVIYE